MSFEVVPNRVPFTMVANAAMRDERLSLQAQGLLSKMLGYREGWKFYMAQLQTTATNGRDAFQNAMKELMEFGYVIRRPDQVAGTGKLAGWAYTVTDQPVSLENRLTAKPSDGKPAAKKNNNKKNNSKKEKDLSASADDAPSNLQMEVASKPNTPTPPHGSQQTQEAPSVSLQGSEPANGKAGSLSSVTALDKVPAAGAAAKAALANELAASYNALRGKLPAVRLPLSAARVSAMYRWAEGVGLEAAPEVWADAVREVATSKHWIENAYGLDNLVRHAEGKAEAWQAKMANGPAPAHGYNTTKVAGGYR